MIKHIQVRGHHALYKDGNLVGSWYGDQKDVVKFMEFLSGLKLNLSENGIITEYAGEAVLEEYLEPNQTWPDTYEELDNAREMGLYKGS